MSLDSLVAAMRDKGAIRLYYKPLAANDNSKNQYYLGPNLDALNVLPVGPTVATVGSHGVSILKASVDFSWLTDEGAVCPTPNAQVIFYPQYPEVRLGSLIQGCAAAPRDLLASRAAGRILLVGVTRDDRVIGRAIASDDPTAREILGRRPIADNGVFVEIDMGSSPRVELLSALRRIAEEGWMISSHLDSAGQVLPCKGQNCGGLTLEAALGVRPNSIAGPDYAGWEIKQHGVADLERPYSGTLTLMTPEPDGGWYRDQGAESFIRRFGYPDTKGRPDRLNFGGHHKVGAVNPRTGLRLVLIGFDTQTCRVVDVAGGLLLIDGDETVAASWSFAKLLDHWRKKHARAAYVPSLSRTDAPLAYRYGFKVCLGVGTGFELLANALACGTVFYDPGLKLENCTSARPTTKRRSQMRVSFRNLADLYDTFEYVDTRTGCVGSKGLWLTPSETHEGPACVRHCSPHTNF